MFVHEKAVTLEVVRRQAQVFIQVESSDPGKISPALTAGLDQVVINIDGGGTSSQAKHQVGFLFKGFQDSPGNQGRGIKG